MRRSDRKPARLVLEDGTVQIGASFGAPVETIGELVFNTSITGYQEILTDPSYRGQTVLLTQPHIGNYGINSEDEESAQIWTSGLIVREACRASSNFRSAGELSEYLQQHGVPGIEQVDTRMLTRRVRSGGAMKVLLTEDLDTPVETLLERIRAAPSMDDVDHVRAVTTKGVQHWTKGHESPFAVAAEGTDASRAPLPIVAYDFGAKRNILRSLVASGFDVTLVPADHPADDVIARQPAGVFLSNGPGDPATLDYAVASTRAIVEAELPVFGICLGHQILSQVFGAQTFKMKFGHHGGNQPVMDLTTGKVEITAQNHSYAVRKDGIPDTVEVTHVNLNDDTVAGIRHRSLPAFSVQYHPEASPGPHDSLYLFERFRRVIEAWQGNRTLAPN